MIELPFLYEFGTYFIFIVLSGIISGYLSGLFGIGGGAVLVPVFYQIFTELGVDIDVRMHVSVGTSLAVIVPTSVRSFLAHKANGKPDLDLLRSWLWTVPLGVALACAIAAIISGESLRVIFAFIALGISVRLLFNREHWRLGDKLPKNPIRNLCGGLMGFLSTFMGIGGGIFNNSFMTLFGRPIHEAIATSSGVGILVSIPGLTGYILAGWGMSGLPPFSVGYVNVPMVLMVIPLTILAAPLGVKTVHKFSHRQIELAFGIFLLLVAFRFFGSL